MLRRLLPLSAATILVLSTWKAVGLPDAAAAGAYLGGSYPTYTGVLAVAGFAIWALVAVVALVLIVSGLRAVESSQRRQRRPARQAMLVLLAGATVFAAGVAHHAALGEGPHGGSLSQASAQLQDH